MCNEFKKKCFVVFDNFWIFQKFVEFPFNFLINKSSSKFQFSFIVTNKRGVNYKIKKKNQKITKKSKITKIKCKKNHKKNQKNLVHIF